MLETKTDLSLFLWFWSQIVVATTCVWVWHLNGLTGNCQLWLISTNLWTSFLIVLFQTSQSTAAWIHSLGQFWILLLSARSRFVLEDGWLPFLVRENDHIQAGWNCSCKCSQAFVSLSCHLMFRVCLYITDGTSVFFYLSACNNYLTAIKCLWWWFCKPLSLCWYESYYYRKPSCLVYFQLLQNFNIQEGVARVDTFQVFDIIDNLELFAAD